MLTFRLKSQTLAVLVTKQKTRPNTHLFYHGGSTTQSLVSPFDCGSGVLFLTTRLPYFGPPSSSLNLFIFPFLLLSSCLSIFPSSTSPQGQLVCEELTTRQLLHCLLSLSSCPLHNNARPCSTNHQPEPQQYGTPTRPIGEEVWGEEAPAV